MIRLSEQLRDWLARVEILARGAEQHRIEALRSLADGRPAEARQHALQILGELPRSPVALALWADATEAMFLDEECREALERLVEVAPFRADVWYRLAQARHRAGVAETGEALERAVEAEEPPGAVDAALLWLAQRDLAAGDAARAERWLARVSLGSRDLPAVRRCLAETLLELGDSNAALQAIHGVEEAPTIDGQGWLLQGRLAAVRDVERATAAFERALLLQAPGADRVVTGFVEQNPRVAGRFRVLVESLGDHEQPRWRAAFAIAEGREAEAVAALAAGVRDDEDPALLRRYAATAVKAREEAAVLDAVELARQRGVSLGETIEALSAALGAEGIDERLRSLDAVVGGPEGEWAASLRQQVYEKWLPANQSAEWTSLLGELQMASRGFGDLTALREVEGLARDLEQPLRVAVMGEFNAGKSSFINALLGEEVAPVGVLPTTATINRMVWAPDRFARLVLHGQEQHRVLDHGALRSTLRDVGPEHVEEVVIYAPLELLRRIELIDTPGFNAPDVRHQRTAREALASAHVGLWLLDASQPLKDSERVVLQEMAASGVPLVAMVNKMDKLVDEESRRAVLEHVTAGLTRAAIPLESPPIGFSARLALGGQQGDAEALAKSHWSAVEALIERLLVSRSGALRERVSRRRARDIADRLSVIARERDLAFAQRSRMALETRRRALSLVSSVAASRRELEVALSRELEVGLVELARALKPVLGGHASYDGRFTTSRTRTLVGSRLADAALTFCRNRFGELTPDLARRYHEQVEFTAGILGPWLAAEALERGRLDANPDSAEGRRGGAASKQLVRAALDELSKLAERSVESGAEPRLDAASVRVLDMAAVLARA